ncbi:M12 family metallo-peptidase [Pinirhizobacter soli]|uniref:M12 family metallo-peptidase n=1 Tax=Pinirhizobacter soli TaxID=2786953 RepID=UPI00202A5E27|nr:M12 family metallo-peptidase [Pinirhizobacter soli]
MHPYPRKICSVLLLALAPIASAMASDTRELFMPMPMAALQSAQDPTLSAIHDVRAYHMINRVAADADALREDTPEIYLSLAPQLHGAVRRTHAQTLPDGSAVWRGQWSDGSSALMGLNTQPTWFEAANEVTLVNRGGRITGSVRANGQLYAIRPLASGGHAIIAVAEDDLPGELPPLESVDTLPMAGDGPTLGENSTNDINARVMIVFSDNATRALADPIALAHLAVAETNDGYARSGVTHRLQMIDTVYASEYKDSGSLGTDLARLTSTNDGFIDWIHARRNENQADLVTLITAGGDACGVGYLNSNAGSAFTVATKDCATGYYSYGHELGHNYGATHDPAAGRNNNYPYGHGFQHLGARLRTVMAYDCSGGCTRVNIWSGPNNRWNGNVMGNAHESDNTRVLNARAGTVGNFR